MTKIKDITNQKFSRLTAICPTNNRGHKGSVIWKCVCDCGNECDVLLYRLTGSRTQSCGCLRKEICSEKGTQAGTKSIKDLTNLRFGKLVVIKLLSTRKNGSVVWECKCDCGNICDRAAYNLRNNSHGVQSCGCLLKGCGLNTVNRANKRFGRLVALSPTTERRNGDVMWECLCDCDNTCMVRSCALSTGNTQSCGCLYCRGSVYLYVFYSVDRALMKIGISGNVLRRKEELEKEFNESLELLYYRLSSRSEEADIHKQLKEYRAVHPERPTSKEWYFTYFSDLKAT